MSNIDIAIMLTKFIEVCEEFSNLLELQNFLGIIANFFHKLVIGVHLIQFDMSVLGSSGSVRIIPFCTLSMPPLGPLD